MTCKQAYLMEKSTQDKYKAIALLNELVDLMYSSSSKYPKHISMVDLVPLVDKTRKFLKEIG